MLSLPVTPWECGVTHEDISGLEKFEGVDPARWCARDFAVVSVDARGSGHSDGYACLMGQQEAEDGYDSVEAIAKLPWCNGKVGLAGNSHLAIIQWFIAAQQPPSLAAIAPWEGLGDLYREQFVRGGIFNPSNFLLIKDMTYRGPNGIEDIPEMYRRTDNGVINDYWMDKRPDMKAVKVPVYVTASEHSTLHTMGGVRAKIELPNQEDVWFRSSSWQEWHDLWAIHETNEELMDFFDYFLKVGDKRTRAANKRLTAQGKENGWRNTPKVRLSLLRFGKNEPLDGIEAPDYPLPDTDYKTWYMGPDSKLFATNQDNQSVVTYNSEDDSSVASFRLTFDKRTILAGLPRAILYLACDDYEDMCVSVQLNKLDTEGNRMVHLTIPFARTPVTDPNDAPQSGVVRHDGPVGLLRASHRHIDHSRSIHPQYPFHPHDRYEPIPKGDIVKLEVGIWAMGILYEAGESIEVVVSGNNPNSPELRQTGAMSFASGTNKGTHKLHIGGDTPSCVILPFVNLGV